MASAPTHGDRHKTVFLDAGHRGIDPGAVGSTEDGAMALLRAPDYRVVVSRTQNTTVTRLSAADVAYGHLMLLGPAQAGYFSTPSKQHPPT